MNKNDLSCGSEGYPSDCEVTQRLIKRALERGAPIQRSREWQEALPKARNVKLLLLDVDGVLTDGTIRYTKDGEESKDFNTQDGFGLRILQESGIQVGIITARTSEAVNRRAADLKLNLLYQGTKNKIDAFREILKKTGLQPFQTGFMGDDWLDLQLINNVGFSAAPANSVAEVKQRVHYVTSRSGGQGAVREVCELIMEASGSFSSIFNNYKQ